MARAVKTARKSCQSIFTQQKNNTSSCTLRRVTMSNKSSVWSSYNKINEKEVQCKLCHAKLAYHRSTTTMHSHLRAKHPAGPSTGQQQSVASFMIRSTKSDARRAEQTTALITKMIAKDMLPINFVEGEGLRSLMEFVEPEFTVPSRKTITVRLEKLFDDHGSCTVS